MGDEGIDESGDGEMEIEWEYGWEAERLEDVVGRLGEWKLGDEGTDENGDGEIEMEWEYG